MVEVTASICDHALQPAITHCNPRLRSATRGYAGRASVIPVCDFRHSRAGGNPVFCRTAGIPSHAKMRKALALTGADGNRRVAIQPLDSRLRGNDEQVDSRLGGNDEQSSPDFAEVGGFVSRELRSNRASKWLTRPAATTIHGLARWRCDRPEAAAGRLGSIRFASVLPAITGMPLRIHHPTSTI